MLKIGFLVPDEEGSELSPAFLFPDLLAADLTEGSCPREKRSEVALGIFEDKWNAKREQPPINQKIHPAPLLPNWENSKLSDNVQRPHPTIMGILVQDLETAIRDAFPIIHLDIQDTSSGCGESYSVFIVSSVSPQ